LWRASTIVQFKASNIIIEDLVFTVLSEILTNQISNHLLFSISTSPPATI